MGLVFFDSRDGINLELLTSLLMLFLRLAMSFLNYHPVILRLIPINTTIQKLIQEIKIKCNSCKNMFVIKRYANNTPGPRDQLTLFTMPSM